MSPRVITGVLTFALIISTIAPTTFPASKSLIGGKIIPSWYISVESEVQLPKCIPPSSLQCPLIVENPTRLFLTKTGITRVTSFRWVPPANGSFTAAAQRKIGREHCSWTCPSAAETAERHPPTVVGQRSPPAAVLSASCALVCSERSTRPCGRLDVPRGECNHTVRPNPPIEDPLVRPRRMLLLLLFALPLAALPACQREESAIKTYDVAQPNREPMRMLAATVPGHVEEQLLP